MAAITTTKSFQFKQHSSTKKLDPFFSNTLFLIPKLPKPLPTTTLQTTTYKKFITKAITTAKKGNNFNERVKQVHSIEEFDVALQTKKNKLVIVIFMVTHSKHSHTLFPLMVDLSRRYTSIEFVLVMGDESDKTKALCERENIKRAPHLSFYRGIEKVHDEEAIISVDDFTRVVSYYGDNHSAVIQLHSRKDVENLIKTNDENDNCKEFLEDMKVVEVPTFLFIRDGEIRGRYVGSGKVKLMGEILRYQRCKSQLAKFKF
ncbi:hypothetical protein MKW98_007954 [Papaver atlanticum]|uniref:Thioredoxin domain-containing protein n=1 Tax=Papaver atlanticum TaxID=357466 RepID=A0AAD4X8X0_9MAGN|nr:hypothetical protein MKW98_007954 [Papaver atlanticum]